MNSMLQALRDHLVREAQRKLEQPKQFIHFTGRKGADELLNDLNNYPHAFVIACIMDRQIRSEKAWLIPWELKERLGSLEMKHLVGLTLEDIRVAMQNPTPLHRFVSIMAENVFRAIQRINNHYGGDAGSIWSGQPSSATIVRRFLEFDGVGLKIATMAANILVRDFRVDVSDRYSIDISVDVQIRRVFARMGFVPEDAPSEYIIYRARELCPEYPGIFDLVLWDIGRNVCRPTEPDCDRCSYTDMCAYSRGKKVT